MTIPHENRVAAQVYANKAMNRDGWQVTLAFFVDRHAVVMSGRTLKQYVKDLVEQDGLEVVEK